MALDLAGSVGYQTLLAAVERDEQKWLGAHDYRGKLRWVIERAKHYAERTGIKPEAILDAWEARRDYWYMNYYQDANQPRIDSANVRVFQTVAEVLAAIGDRGFRCPNCGGVSTDPAACDSGILVKLTNHKGRSPCNWKAWGLFRDLGKGVHVFCVENMAWQLIFMPVAWESPKTGERLAKAVAACLVTENENGVSRG